jgi:hypothetical protein
MGTLRRLILGSGPPQGVDGLIGLPDRHQVPPAVAHQHREVLGRAAAPVGDVGRLRGRHPWGRRCSARNRIGAASRPRVQQASVGRGRPAVSSQMWVLLNHPYLPTPAASPGSQPLPL